MLNTGTDPEEVIRNAFACFDDDSTGVIHEDRYVLFQFITMLITYFILYYNMIIQTERLDPGIV